MRSLQPHTSLSEAVRVSGVAGKVCVVAGDAETVVSGGHEHWLAGGREGQEQREGLLHVRVEPPHVNKRAWEEEGGGEEERREGRWLGRS